MSINNVHSPYKLEWLDSCVQETLLPGSPWTKIRDAINNSLATKVKAFCKNSESNAILPLLELLGKPFVEKYLQDVTVSVHEQDSSSISTSSLFESRKEEAKIWLQASLKEITDGLRLNWRGGGDTETDVSRDMSEFVGFTQQVVYRGMERELGVVEKQEKYGQQIRASGRSPSDLLGNSHQSEALGKAVSALLKNHPSQLNRVCEQLQGRQLSSSLRPIIWSIRLLGKNAADNVFSKADLDAQLEEISAQFISSLSWCLKELGVSSAVHSPIAGVIRHAVTEAHKYRYGLQSEVVSDTHLRHALEALNVLYAFNRSYEPHFALLVFPLTFALQSEYTEFSTLNVHVPGRFVVSHNLAVSLHLLLKNCFPTRVEILSMADHVLQRLHLEDEELYSHLVNETKNNLSFDPQEFLVNFIHTEKEKAVLAEKQASGSALESLPSDAKQLIFHPTMFIRKWIGEGFVGTLGIDAVMIVWDQCFMSSWRPSVMENTCLVILQLLRSHILDAGGYTGIRRVLLDRPSELFTLDVQKGLSYLNNGGALMDVVNLRPSTHLPPLSEHEEILPTPSPPRPVSRRSAQSTPLLADPEELWVERIMSPSTTEVTTNHESFDLYIDEVRFIPDNATVIKVTGRILDPFWKKPETLDIPDIEAFPQLDSSARCPKFRFRCSVNVPAEGVTGEAVMLFRIYTLDVNTGELIVVGNSIVRIFNGDDNDEWHLNVGGHQLRLKHLLPSTVAKLTEEAFEGITNVPVCSILIRLLPHYEEYIQPPGYSSGYYFSEHCKPNDSEWRIFRRFKSHEAYPPTVREAVRDVKEGETDHEDGFDITNDLAVNQWYQRWTSKHLLMRQPAKPMDLVKAVQYDQKQGLSLVVEQAFGLAGNIQFVNVLVYVSARRDTQSQQISQDGYGGEEKALVKMRDFNSYQKSPKWIDPPIEFHPHISGMTTLVIRLCSIDASYAPRPDRAAPGSVTANKGKNLSIVPFCWTVLPLFSRQYVNAGVHYLPLFEGSPSPTFLEFLSSHPVDVSMTEAIRQNVHRLQGVSCVAVRLWDAHYSLEDCIPLPVHEELLSVSKQEKYKKAIQTTSGKLLSELVLQTLTTTERKQGVRGNAYMVEKEHYEEAMNNVFSSLVDDVLLESGMGPMTG